MILLFPIIIWLSALLRCEILTFMHYKEFNMIYQEDTMIGEIECLKVLKYEDQKALIYYVSVNKTGGDIVEFYKKNGDWIFCKWKTVWSGSGGSASGVIWPYWWHFIYGGF